MINKPFRILSLNGGGIRGIFQAVFLNKIAKDLPAPLHQNFDMICGTSTGSIVGMAIAMGVDLNQIINLYKTKGSEIFNKRTFLAQYKRGPIYRQDVLKKQLTEIFQNNQLRDAKTKVLIASASINQFNHKVFANFKILNNSDEHLSIADVVLSSTAAPTYFHPVRPAGQERHYVDGGVWANSPASLGILFARKYLNISANNIRLISVGTGDMSTSATFDHFNNMRQFSRKAITTIFELMFASQASFSDLYAKEILGDERYVRISARLDEEIALDDVQKALDKLPSLAEQAADIEVEKIKKLLHYDAQKEIYIQNPEREKLISNQLVEATGLTAFYPEREYYKLRGDSSTIDSYINTAKDNLIMVSVSLVKGINFDNLRSVLIRKLESQEKDFEVTISLLNPHKEYLMESLAAVFEKDKAEIASEIKDGVKKLKHIYTGLSRKAKPKMKLKFHNSIPFGSAIIIDRDKPYGKIQIETKAYKVPMGKSFAFEVVPIKKDGYFNTLLDGYLTLLEDGEEML